MSFEPLISPGFLVWDGSKWIIDDGYTEVVGPVGPAGPSGQVGVASGDLSRDFSGPISVVGLTGSGGAASHVSFANTINSPTIDQNSTSSSSGQTLSLIAQTALDTGGALLLKSGNADGAGGTSGNVTLQTGTGTIAGSVLFMLGGNFVASFDQSKFTLLQGRRVKVTQTTITYNVLVTDEYISVGTLSAPITIVMPSSSSTGDIYTIKDANGSATIHNITISGNGYSIDNSANYILSSNYAKVTLIYNGSKWLVV